MSRDCSRLTFIHLIAPEIDQETKQVLFDLKYTVPVEAATVAKVLGTFQVGDAVRALERKLRTSGPLEIAPEVARRAAASWDEEADALSLLRT